LAYGRASGIATGVGAAGADTFYGAIAAFGLTLISSFLLAHQVWLRLAGGIFLVVMGVRAFRARITLQLATSERPNLARAAISSFLLTLSNPITLLAFGAVFGAVGIVDPDLARLDAVLLVCGVFTGSMLWWLAITAVVSGLRARTSEGLLHLMSEISGVLIALFGVGVLATVLPF
jgi:threonine/homoserine/homoserine lactone efflux protein